MPAGSEPKNSGGWPTRNQRRFMVELRQTGRFLCRYPRPRPGTAEGESLDLASADLGMTIMPDHAVVGSAVYETKPQPAGSSKRNCLRRARSSGRPSTRAPITPLKAADGQWLVPLGTNGPNRVSLFWSQRPEFSSRTSQVWALTLPPRAWDRSHAGHGSSSPRAFHQAVAGGPGASLAGPARPRTRLADRTPDFKSPGPD